MRSVPYGEILIFTITMSILMYLVKKNGYGSDPVSLALQFIVGREEARKKKSRRGGENCDNATNGAFSRFSIDSLSGKSFGSCSYYNCEFCSF